MSGLQVYQAGGQGVVTAQFPPVKAPRNPVSASVSPQFADKVGSDGSPYELLRQWINTTTKNTFTYLGAGVWVLSESLGGTILSMSDTAATQVLPSAAGNIQLNGMTNQIVVTAGTNSFAFTIPATFIAPGSIAATTSLTATLGNITATNGNLVLSTAGNKLVINAATPTASSVGTTAAMITGATTITSSAITASSKIIYSRRTLGTAMGNVSITAQAGGSATLTSDEGTETSTFDYLIIN